MKEATARPSIATVAAEGDKPEVMMTKASDIITIKGNGYTAQFDIKTGTIYSLTYGNEKVITDGNGPKLDALRAFTNNDNWFYSQWFDNGLHNLKHSATGFNMTTKEDGTVVLSFTVQSQAPNAAKILGGTSSGKNKIEELTDKKFGSSDFKFTTNQVWTCLLYTSPSPRDTR